MFTKKTIHKTFIVHFTEKAVLQQLSKGKLGKAGASLCVDMAERRQLL